MLAAREPIQKRIEQLEKERSALQRGQAVEAPQLPGALPGQGDTFAAPTKAEAMAAIEDSLTRAKNELLQHPDPEAIGSLSQEGTIVESPMMSGLRILSGGATAATIRITRELASPVDDPQKPAEEYGFFEYNPKQVNPLIPGESDGGLTNSEAGWAAVALMPTFYEQTQSFPRMGSSDAAIYTSGTLATIADVAMPVGPEAIGIAAAPFTGGTSLLLTVGAKTTKIAAKGIRIGSKTKKLDTVIDLLDSTEDFARTVQSAGLNKAPGYAQQVIAKNAAVAQSNRLLAQVEAPTVGGAERAKEVLNPFSTPQTIRGRAAAAIADTSQPLIDDAIVLRTGDDAARAARLSEMSTGAPNRKRFAANYADTPDDLGGAYRRSIDEQIASVPADTLDPAFVANLRLSSVIVDDLASGAKARNMYGDLFQRTYSTRLLSNNKSLRSTIKESISQGKSIEEIDAILSSAPFDADSFRGAANDALRTQADNALYNRAPSDDVFFTSRLLIDRKTAESLPFIRRVTGRKEELYNGLTPDKVFAEPLREGITLQIIEELGAATIRESNELTDILTNLVKGRPLDDAAFRIVDDALTTRIAKEEIENLRGIAREAPLTSERGFSRATATDRQRFSFPRSMADVRERLGLQQAPITNRDLARATSGVRGRLRRSRPELQTTSPTALRFAVTELDDIGNSVFEETAQRLKAAAKRDESAQEVDALLGEAVQDSQRNQKRLLEQTAASYQRQGMEQAAAVQEAAQKLGLLPARFKIDDMSAALGREATAADVPEYLNSIFNVSANKSFVESYLKDFFSFVPEKQLVQRTRSFGNIATTIAEDLQARGRALSFADLEDAIANARAIRPGLRDRGLAKGVVTHTDATLEAALARTIRTTASARGQRIIAQVIDTNPQLRIDLVDTPTTNMVAGAANPQHTAVALFEDVIRLFEDADPAAVAGIRESQDRINAAMQRALQSLDARYTNKRATTTLLNEMTEALLTEGLHGVEAVIQKENIVLQNVTRSMKAAFNEIVNAAERGMKPAAEAGIKAELEVMDAATQAERKVLNEALADQRKRIEKLYGEDVKQLRADLKPDDKALRKEAKEAAEALPSEDIADDIAALAEADAAYQKAQRTVTELDTLEKQSEQAGRADEAAIREWEKQIDEAEAELDAEYARDLAAWEAEQNAAKQEAAKQAAAKPAAAERTLDGHAILPEALRSAELKKLYAELKEYDEITTSLRAQVEAIDKAPLQSSTRIQTLEKEYAELRAKAEAKSEAWKAKQTKTKLSDKASARRVTGELSEAEKAEANLKIAYARLRESLFQAGKNPFGTEKSLEKLARSQADILDKKESIKYLRASIDHQPRGKKGKTKTGGD